MTINGIDFQGIPDFFLSIFAVGAIIAVIVCLILLSGFILCYSVSLWISAKWMDVEGRSYGKSFISALLLCAAWGLLGFLGFFFNEIIVAFCSLLFCPIFLIKFVYDCPITKAVLTHYGSILVQMVLFFIFIIGLVLTLSFFQLGKKKTFEHGNQVAVTLKTEPASPAKIKQEVEEVAVDQKGAKIPAGVLPDLKEPPQKNKPPANFGLKPVSTKTQLSNSPKVPAAKAKVSKKKPAVVQIKAKTNSIKKKK